MVGCGGGRTEAMLESSEAGVVSLGIQRRFFLSFFAAFDRQVQTVQSRPEVGKSRLSGGRRADGADGYYEFKQRDHGRGGRPGPGNESASAGLRPRPGLAGVSVWEWI